MPQHVYGEQNSLIKLLLSVEVTTLIFIEGESVDKYLREDHS